MRERIYPPWTVRRYYRIYIQNVGCSPLVSGTAEVFVCTTGETVALSTLCDGNADCSNGNDETSPICESKKMKCNCMVLILYHTLNQGVHGNM